MKGKNEKVNEKEEIYPKNLVDEDFDIEEKTMSIFYDKQKNQYTIRIPKEFAEGMKLDPAKHKFKFTLITPSHKNKDEKIQLKGEIIND